MKRQSRRILQFVIECVTIGVGFYVNNRFIDGHTHGWMLFGANIVLAIVVMSVSGYVWMMIEERK